MLKSIIAVLRERHIGQVMSGIFVLFAMMSLADALQDPFLNRVVHFLNAHSSEYPLYEPRVYGLQVALKSFDVVLLTSLAYIFHRWFGQKREGELRD